MTKSFASLRAHLILPAFLVVLPALGLILYTNLERRQQEAVDTQAEALRLARMAAVEQEQMIEGARQMLVGLAQLPVVRDAALAAPAARQVPVECKALFANLLEQFPFYTGFTAATPNGDIFCSAPPFAQPVNFSDRAWYRRLVQTHQFVAGEYQIDRISGKAVQVLAYPVLDPTGQLQAIVTVGLDLAWLNLLANEVQLPPSSVFMVTDRNGIVLARSPDPETWVGQSVAEAAIIQAILAQGEGTIEETGLDGVTRLYAFIPLSASPDTDIEVYVSIGIPVEVAFAEADRMLARNLILFGLVTTFIFITTLIGSNPFVLRRMQALLRATEQVAAGDLDARTHIPYGQGELGQLGRAWDRMAETLAQRRTERQRAEAELRRLNRALKASNECNQALLRASAETELMHNICQIIVAVGGYRLAWVGLAEQDEARTVRPIAQAGFETGYLKALNITWADTERGRGPTGTAIRTGKPCVATNILTDPTFAPWREAALERGYASSIALPLIAKAQPLGALNIYAAEADAFDAEEVKLLTALANDLAYGLMTLRTHAEREQAVEEVRRRNQELELLNAIIAISASGMEAETILETACRQLALAFDLPQTAATLLNEEKTEAVIVAEYLSTDSKHGLVEDRRAALHQTIPVANNPSFQYLLTHKTSLVADDAQHDPRLAPIHDLLCQRGTVSLLFLPLIIEGEVIGSIGLDAIEPRNFSPQEINLAWSVADQVAGALARARLSQQSRLLNEVVEQTPRGIIITDPQGTILYVNPAFEQATGYSRSKAVGQNPRLLKSGEHTPAFYEEMWQTITAGQVWQGRIVNKKKDGTLYTDETIITPVRDEAGTITNYVAIMHDMTRELELEEQYRQSQKMEAVGQLTSGIAHDFNNLLTAINGFAELLQVRLPPDSPSRNMVDNILHSGQQAADLVGQLLAFSRKQIIEPKVLDLNTVVAGMDKMLQRIIGEDVKLTTILSSGLWPVKVDSSQLEQVILNLAVNARDAMPEGGRLTIETGNVVLDEVYVSHHFGAQPGEYIILVMSDTGTGINKEVQARIFEPFFTTKEKGKGTGLGLSTIYGIVKQSGGDIRVYSEPGHGTTFKIYLPRTEEAGSTPTPREQLGLALYGTETILLVEDDPDVRNLVRQVLQELGYTLLEAPEAQAALALAARYTGPLHLLLTDVVMPGLSGKALSDQLTQSYPDLRSLFMSGYTDNAIVHHGVLEPGTDFIQKPFSAAALARKVREVLS